MSRHRAVVIVLVGCCLLLGGGTIESLTPAVAASTATSRTAPRGLTKHYPLGPQRLCCQSTSQSQTAAAPPSSGTAGAGSSAGGSAGSTHHASSGFTVVVFWIILGVAVVGLLAAGVADLRRAHRESARALPPGITAADYLARARAAADLASSAHRERLAADSPPVGAVQDRRRRGRPETVEELAYRRADLRDRNRRAFNRGVARHERGDLSGAMAAYRRAERLGDPDASFNLGVLLCEAGDLDGAEAAWRLSARRGTARGAEDLGFLVRRQRERGAAGTERQGAER